MLDVPEVRYARIGDGHVAYQVVGDGPIDVLVAPGFISHLDLQWTMPTYASFVEGLASFSRVILFDKRGTGLSDPSPDAARFDQRVEDVPIGAVEADDQHGRPPATAEGEQPGEQTTAQPAHTPSSAPNPIALTAAMRFNTDNEDLMEYLARCPVFHEVDRGIETYP